MDFLRQKSVFFLRKSFDVPHAIGVFGRTFVEPITPELSQRGRLLGAVAQWQLRLCFERAKGSDEVSIVPRLLAFWFFFRVTYPLHLY